MSRSGYARIRRIGSKKMRRWRFWKRNYFVIPEEKYSGEKMRSISLHEVHTPQEEARMWQRRSGIW